MQNQRRKLQTSSQPKRKGHYMLPLSKPRLIMDQSSFKNISSDADRTFTSTSSKINFSLKCLKTQRLCQRSSINLQAQETRRDYHIPGGVKHRNEKCKFDIILCVQDKQINLTTYSKDVGQLTKEIKNYLKFNKFNPKLKTIQSCQDKLALNYLLSVVDIPLHGLLYPKIKIRPYYGLEQPEINIKSFQIIRAIGSGGFSTVYLVRCKLDGKYYAMKVLSKAFISKHKKQRLVMNQRHVLKSIDHPYLAKLYWSFQSKNYLIFILDYFPGGELFGVLKRFKRMSQGMARFYITEILLGLQALHHQGIAYRDLKPENILIDKDGHACISDFGLVKLGLKRSNSRTFSFCGSPQYMPPQVISRKGHSINADFYSLGALLYELLTGLPPFYNQDPEEIYKGTLNGSLSVPSYLTENAKNLLINLLNKSQINRLGAKNGVQEIFEHPWFSNIDRNSFVDKNSLPPITFRNVEDLSFNEGQMKKSNNEYIILMLKQQEQVEKCPNMLPDFKYSHNQNNSEAKQNRENNASITRLKLSGFKKKESINSTISRSRLKKYDNFF